MKQADTMTAPEFIQAQVRAQLRVALVEEAELDRVDPAPTQKHSTEVLPGWSSPVATLPPRAEFRCSGRPLGVARSHPGAAASGLRR
jgi:hypothetical protein